MTTSLFSQWRANFLTGLAIVLPAAISIAIVRWLFGTVANFTDALLFFLPTEWTYPPGSNAIYWYWSLLALMVAVLLISLVGRSARHYIGKKLIEWFDQTLLRIPLLNKIYGAIKQINEAFSSSEKSSFRQVVLVQFPREGQYSIGFLTGDRHPEAEFKTGLNLVSVVIPTTPNPTSGFLILVPADSIIKLDMSVADGINNIISLGSLAPGFRGGPVVVAEAVRSTDARPTGP